MKTAVLILLLGAGTACGGLPLLTPTRVVKDSIGGDYTSAMVVEADGKKVFIKSLRSKPYPEEDPRGGRPRMLELTRWGNFEADILAKELFNLVDVQSPASRVVTLPPGHVAARRLGDTVVAMEFVDASFARGGTVQEGFWPGADKADLDGFINMALVDILMGNADRRDPNYFVAVLPDGMVRPVPIDNNSGFTTFLVWTRTSNLCNFWPTYRGLGAGWPWEMLGTIGNVVVRGAEVHHVHERVLDDRRFRGKVMHLARALAAKLTDAEIDRMVALIPPEIIPPEVKVRLSPDLAAQLSAPEFRALVPDPRVTLQGAELFRRRVAELRSTLRWRRTNLVAGLTDYFRRQGGPIEGQPPRPPVKPPVKPPVIANPPVGEPPPLIAQPPGRPRPSYRPWLPGKEPISDEEAGRIKGDVDPRFSGLPGTDRQ